MVVLAYLGAVPTALAYICYFYGMQLSRSATSGIAATLVEPAVAVLLAAGLLGEHLPPTAWLGMACLPFAAIALGLEGSRLIPARLHLTPVALSQREPSERHSATIRLKPHACRPTKRCFGAPTSRPAQSQANRRRLQRAVPPRAGDR
jgi:EamA-like transporter family